MEGGERDGNEGVASGGAGGCDGVGSCEERIVALVARLVGLGDGEASRRARTRMLRRGGDAADQARWDQSLVNML